MGRFGIRGVLLHHLPVEFGGMMLTRIAALMGFVPIAGQFTGKERDVESGLDFFGARYLSSAQGRFTSVDPIWVKVNRLLDPQRLNLYAYGRNNPLRFSDPTGMDVRLGNCPANMTVTQCFAAVQNTVPKDDRSHVHLVKGDGKNGFENGQYGITVDADYKSTSGNFKTLQSAANDHSGVASVNIMQAGQTFPSLIGVQRGSNVAAVPFKDVFGQDNYVSQKDAVPGQTLFLLIGQPLANSIYSTSAVNEIYAAADETLAELSATIAHELVHVVLGQFGKKVASGVHFAPGVNDATKAAEDEAIKNAANQ